jgi:hypothetical protein
VLDALGLEDLVYHVGARGQGRVHVVEHHGAAAALAGGGAPVLRRGRVQLLAQRRQQVRVVGPDRYRLSVQDEGHGAANGAGLFGPGGGGGHCHSSIRRHSIIAPFWAVIRV